jgi:hypothetical protein
MATQLWALIGNGTLTDPQAVITWKDNFFSIITSQMSNVTLFTNDLYAQIMNGTITNPSAISAQYMSYFNGSSGGVGSSVVYSPLSENITAGFYNGIAGGISCGGDYDNSCNRGILGNA